MQCRIVLGLAILVSASFASREFPLEEYKTRQAVISKLDTIYDQYRLISTNHPDVRKKLLSKFMALYNQKFNVSDEWLLDAFLSDDGILQETMEANGFDFPKTKTFMESIYNLYDAAGQQRIRFEIHSKNYTEADRLGDVIDEGKEAINNRSNEVLDLIRTKLYRTQYKKDVVAMIKTQGQSSDLPNLVVKRLKEKFPFRSWVAVLYNPNEENFMCNNPEMFDTTAKSRRLIVVHVDSAFRSNKQLANQFLGRVEDSKRAWWHSCDDRGREILQHEAKYDCSRKSFQFVAVFKSENGMPSIAASDKDLINSKLTYRARLSFICQAYFRVMFLA